MKYLSNMLSNCCKAKVKSNWEVNGEEGCNFYICTKCYQACDVKAIKKKK